MGARPGQGNAEPAAVVHQKHVSPEYIAQIIVHVRRGLTDNTAAMVYPWEVPILEIIHGEGNVVESDESDVETTAYMKRSPVNQPVDTVLPLLNGAEEIREAYDPSRDIAGEYGRMINKYGMHPDNPLPVVEYVYGQLKTGQFEAAVLDCMPDSLREGREATLLADGGADGMSGAQVRTALDKRKIPFQRTASVTKLRKILNLALEEERDALNDAAAERAEAKRKAGN